MKQTFKLALLCTIAVLSLHAKKDKDSVLDSINQKVSRINRVVTEINEKEKCTNVIMASDIGTTGYVITEPGDYCLGEDVVFNPPTPATGQVTAAITIASSNVNLSLNNHRLSQAGAGTSTQSPFVVGILVPDVIPGDADVNAIGLQSIYINGDQAIIDGFSMYGVRIFAHTYDIMLANLTIKNCGALASAAIRSQNAALANYFPKGLPGAAGVLPMGIGGLCIGESDIFGMGSVFFTQSSGVAQNRVSSLVIDNVSCLNNYFMGLCVANSTDVTINNSHIDDTYNDDPALFVLGASFGPADMDAENPSILNMTVSDSTFNNTTFRGDYTTAAPGYIAGFSGGAAVAKAKNVSFTRCSFDNSLSTFTGITLCGFVGSSINNTTFDSCSFDGSQGVTAAAGIHISGFNYYDSSVITSDNVNILNCTANNIQQIGNLQIPPTSYFTPRYFPSATGYQIFFTKNLTIDSSTATDIICNGPARADSTAAGFFIAGGSDSAPQQFESDNLTLKDCVAARVQTLQGGSAVGFFALDFDPVPGVFPTWNLRTISLDSCLAEGCQALLPTFTSVVQGAAIGFWFDRTLNTDSAFPISYTNCKALYNKGVPFVSNVGGGLGGQYSAGFYASSTVVTGTAQNHTYYNCEATANVYGFLLSNCSQFSIRDCRADNNLDDITFTTGEGFTDLGAPAGTPAAPGTSSSLFEGNHAFNNGGNDTTYSGINSNYNIVPASVATPPILEVKIADGTIAPINPATYFAGVHNISTIK